MLKTRQEYSALRCLCDHTIFKALTSSYFSSYFGSDVYLCPWSTTALEGNLHMILGLGSPVAEQFSLS